MAKPVLYILIFVGIFIYTALKDKVAANAKRKASTPHHDAHSSHSAETTSMDELSKRIREFERSLKEENASLNSNKSVSQPANKKKTSSPFLSTEEGTFNHTNSKKQAKNKVKQSVVTPIEDSEIGKQVDVAFGTPEDAKRAFVYSEIWNRKY